MMYCLIAKIKITKIPKVKMMYGKIYHGIYEKQWMTQRKLGTESAASKKTKRHLTSHLFFLDRVVHERSSTSDVPETVSELLEEEEITQEEAVSQNKDESQIEEVILQRHNPRRKEQQTVFDARKKIQRDKLRLNV